MRIAVTGGIGEGKSTVLRMLSELGASTISSDEVARPIFDDPAVNQALAEIAGRPAPISRSEFRSALAESSTARRAANRLMHRRVMSVLLNSPAVFCEVPLLLEGCVQSCFDRVWLVTCGFRIQRERLLERYGDEAHVDALLASQLPSRVKSCFADRIIRTNQPEESVRRLLRQALQHIGGE